MSINENINDLYQMISSNFKKIRVKQNITQENLAEVLDLSRSHISKIEAPGIDVGVSIDTLFLIATTYNIDIRRFFDGYEQFMNDSDKKES